jgi:hypothetical protein
MIAKAVSAVVLTVTLASGGTNSCENQERPSNKINKMVVNDGEYNVNKLKEKGIIKMTAVNPTQGCKWATFYDVGNGKGVVIQQGDWKKNKVNFNKTRTSKAGKKYKATSFRTSGCKTWVRG